MAKSMAVSNLPDVELLHSTLAYNPKTGVLTWKVRPDYPQKWNTRYAGKEAGSTFTTQSGKTYRKVKINGKDYYAHRIAWVLMGKKLKPGKDIDHRDGDGLNNRKKNLRKASRHKNMCNTKLRNDSTTGHVGVNIHGNGFVARGWYNKKAHYIGFFTSLKKAVKARQKWQNERKFTERHGTVT